MLSRDLKEAKKTLTAEKTSDHPLSQAVTWESSAWPTSVDLNGREGTHQDNKSRL